MSEGLRKSPINPKTKFLLYSFLEKKTARVSPIGWVAPIWCTSGEAKKYYFFVLTLTCRHSQKLKLTSRFKEVQFPRKF